MVGTQFAPGITFLNRVECGLPATVGAPIFGWPSPPTNSTRSKVIVFSSGLPSRSMRIVSPSLTS